MSISGGRVFESEGRVIQMFWGQECAWVVLRRVSKAMRLECGA